VHIKDIWVFTVASSDKAGALFIVILLETTPRALLIQQMHSASGILPSLTHLYLLVHTMRAQREYTYSVCAVHVSLYILALQVLRALFFVHASSWLAFLDLDFCSV
jgi:hypothetical protein